MLPTLGTTTWTYGARGRLSSGTLSGVVYSYNYNGLGQRVIKSSTALATGGVIFAYDEGGHLVGEYNMTGARILEHVYLGDRPVLMIGGGGLVYPVLTDHLGTPRQVINASKQLRWGWNTAEPFGANAANQNPAGLGAFPYNLRFPGQYFDSESGLFYNYFRDYSPGQGRYIQSDPIGLEGGLNTYIYVEGNPLNYTDPLGLIKIPPAMTRFGGIGARAIAACMSLASCRSKLIELERKAQKLCSKVQCKMHKDREGHSFEVNGTEKMCAHYQIDCWIEGQKGIEHRFSSYWRLPALCWNKGEDFPTIEW